MPWTSRDSHAKTHKATTPTAKRQWKDVANSVLAKTGDDARAIREANAVIARRPAGRPRTSTAHPGFKSVQRTIERKK